MRNLLITLLLCTVALSAKAQQLYEDKNIDYSFDSLKVEAAKGNVIAIHKLGDCYNFGRQVNKTFYDRTDYDRALEHYKKASDYGYPWAAWEIGRMYGTKKLKDTDTGTNEEMWYDKAFKEFKLYADRGETGAYNMLAEYYGGYWGRKKYTDPLKNLYWSLCAVDAGDSSGAFKIAMIYAYGKGVERDSVFALAWYARSCVEYKYDNLKEMLDYKKLINAGYTEADFERLAKYTYLPVPRISTQNEDSINDVAIFAIDLLQSRAEDFHIAYLADQQRRAANAKARAVATDNGSFTSSTIPSATYAETKAAASKGRKRTWLSAIGRALNAAGAAASGQSIASSLTQSVSNGTAGNAENSANAAMTQAFKYSGEQRKGQQDFNGRIIRNELTTPCAYGQVHYTWYEDGYCLAYSVSTCVGCYGRKICTICQGQGRTYNSYLKSYKQCSSCLGSGRCKYCQGAGHQTISKLWAPGEAEAYLSAKQEVAEESSSSSGSSSSSSQSGTCSKCHGKGYEPKSYTYAAQSRYAPYHNSAGTSCNICGQSTDHYHYRCTQCKRN